MGVSRRRYRQFIADGLLCDQSAIFNGGDAIRSLGGWEVIIHARQDHECRIGDKRIPGSSEFVDEVLWEGQLQIAARIGYQRCGLDLTALVAEVFQHFALDPMRKLCQAKHGSGGR